jgi:hypothetical protein
VMVGHDGVCRSFDGDRNVVDAIGLSPRQIKELLDRTEWSQDIEDRFRDIDGRNVFLTPFSLGKKGSLIIVGDRPQSAF